MKLIQWNLKQSFRLTLQFTAIGLVLGGLYHTRMGYELLTPPPLPERTVKPQIRDGVIPKPCVGADAEKKSFGYTRNECPKNHVMVANFDVMGPNKSGPGNFVELNGLCCPLPANDILTRDHLFEKEVCPDDYVVTGGEGDCSENCLMRCTRINTDRYTLGPETMSYYVKREDAGRTFGQGGAKRILWKQLPAGIRYGVLRKNSKEWLGDSCLGVPLGAILTKKNTKRCDGFYYRELRYLDGVPVKIIPDCEVLSDPYSFNPICLDKSKEEKAVKAVNIRHQDKR